MSRVTRRVHGRLYFFEVFTLANFALIAILAARDGLAVFRTLGLTAAMAVPSFFTHAVAGVAIRALVEAARGRGRRFLRVVGTRGWLSDTLRLIAGGWLLTHTYAWIKLTVPLFHPRLFDQELWDLDQAIGFGFAPTILLLDLFAATPALRAIDWSYANIFFASMYVSFTFFLSHPSRRVRISFMNGNALLWIAGGWLYMLVPSVGPAYRFPEIWLEHAKDLVVTQRLQAILMTNYQRVLRLAHDPSVPGIHIAFGVAAFPSLHVAFQAYIFLWTRRVWRSGEGIFALFLLVIFLGSMVTGWHYLVDALAGIALAAGAYAASARGARIRRWAALRERVGNIASAAPV